MAPNFGGNTHQLKPGSEAGGRAIRRGEGGGRGVGWAFRVVRGWGGDRDPPRWEPGDQDAGDHEGNKSRSPPPFIHPRPYGM